MTSIGTEAFYGCSGLAELIIPASVTSIGDWAFYGCSGLTTLYSLNTTPPSADAYTFDDNQYRTVDVFVPEEALETYQTADVWKNFWKLQAILDDDDTTAIALPEIENGIAPIYTLHGQRVTTPQKGGIYIVGGKKVVVK